jgi:hypothetical protein
MGCAAAPRDSKPYGDPSLYPRKLSFNNGPSRYATFNRVHGFGWPYTGEKISPGKPLSPWGLSAEQLQRLVTI